MTIQKAFNKSLAGGIEEFGTFTITPGAIAAGNGSLTSPALAIGSTDTQVANVAFNFLINGLTLAKAAVAAGTALAAGTIPANQWGIYLFSINASGTIAVAAGALNFTTGYPTEAAAIAALPATPANQASMGYVTVQTATGQTFVGGTDSLKGGASGHIALNTNYYNTLYAPFILDNPDGLGPVCNLGDQLFVSPRTLEAGLELTNVTIVANPNVGIITPTNFAIGTTPQAVATTAGIVTQSNLPVAVPAVPAGTTLPAGTIPQNTYGIFLVSAGPLGAITITPGAANYTVGYSTAALALAALPATPLNNIALGYFTIINTTAGGFVSGTTALNASGVTVNYVPYNGGTGLAQVTIYNNRMASVTGAAQTYDYLLIHES